MAEESLAEKMLWLHLVNLAERCNEPPTPKQRAEVEEAYKKWIRAATR